MKRMIHKLKKKWNIQRDWDLIAVILVFSLAGMSIGFFRRPVFHALGITAQTPLWIKIVIYIPLIVPIYQINLIIYGFLLGQFRFFWEKEKRIARFLLRILSGRKTRVNQK
jgi:hypothetical protein